MVACQNCWKLGREFPHVKGVLQSEMGRGTCGHVGTTVIPNHPFCPFLSPRVTLLAKVAGLCHRGGGRMDDCRDGCKPREWRF